MNSEGQSLIIIKSHYSFTTIENCTIKANYSIGILSYPDSTMFKKIPLTQLTLRNTQIEDAIYTVIGGCSFALFEEGSKLIIINSTIRSSGNCIGTGQFLFSVRTRELSNCLLAIQIENPRFENLSSYGTGVIDYRGQSGAFIRNSTFKGNSGVSGGALSLQSGNVTIEDSQFHDNHVSVTTLCGGRGKEGYGGAILLDSYGQLAVVKINNSSFVNNKAECVGSSVYMGSAGYIVIEQTQFVTHFTTPSDTIWFSYSYSLILDHVSIEARNESKLGGKLFVAIVFLLSERFASFKCPIGSLLQSSNSSHSEANNIIVECQYCPNGTYTLRSSNMSVSSANKEIQNRFHSHCQSCSFGAVCQHGIKPKPNFWGYVHKSKAFMILCPPGYCCQTSNQCMALDSCNNKRTGRLCGKCEHGYFQSVFTSDCLEEKVCKTEKFWAVAIITCLMFTVMFIFLQDIFSCIVKILNLNSLALLFQRRVEYISESLLPMKKNSDQMEIRREKELDYDREGMKGTRNNELETKEQNTEPNSTSAAAGLIKIVFFFYQIHSILTVYKSNREIQYLGDLKAFILSIFNLNAQVPMNSEFHCPLHGMGSITKVWIKALFPVSCLVLVGSIYACVRLLSYFFSRNDFVQKHSTKAKPRVLTAILQLTLLGYSTLTSSILSLVSCISLVNGDRILYIDGNVPCYQPWQNAILTFIVWWAIPLIYALHKLPPYIRNGDIAIRGVLTALLLPLPFAVYIMVRDVQKTRLVTSDESSNNPCMTPLIPNVRMKGTNVTMSLLLNVIEGPFRYRISVEKERKLSWEPVLLLQRILLSLCHTFVLQPGLRSLLLLLLSSSFSL